MVARKKAKKAKVKGRTSKKSSTPVQSTASQQQAELDELRAMREETAKELAELKKQREAFKAERDLERINADLAEGTLPTVDPGSPTDKALTKLQQDEEKLEQERVERERHEAREARRLKRMEEKEQARLAQGAQGAKKVASLDEARARKQPVNPAAVEDKPPFTLPMPELHKYKLTVLNTNYQKATDKLKEPLILKYNQLLAQELKTLSQTDPECMVAHKAQVSCINELIMLLDEHLPEGYAITQLLTEKGEVVANYVPNRAGKPLPLPGMVPEGG